MKGIAMFGAPLPVHQCETGKDAMAHARAVRDKRRALFAVPKPVSRVEPLVIIPEPVEPVALPPYEPQKPLTFLQPPPLTHPSIREIQNAVCDVAGIGINDMLSPRRTKSVVKPRQIAIALCKKLTLRSLPEIGRKFGGRDHTTVLHSVRRLAPVMAALDLSPGAKTHEWAEAAWRAAQTIPLADYGKVYSKKERT